MAYSATIAFSKINDVCTHIEASIDRIDQYREPVGISIVIQSGYSGRHWHKWYQLNVIDPVEKYTDS